MYMRWLTCPTPVHAVIDVPNTCSCSNLCAPHPYTRWLTCPTSDYDWDYKCNADVIGCQNLSVADLIYSGSMHCASSERYLKHLYLIFWAVFDCKKCAESKLVCHNLCHFQSWLKIYALHRLCHISHMCPYSILTYMRGTDSNLVCFNLCPVRRAQTHCT